jgi:ectoine hydroxylase-related dioxygenase (phytanoyl-CoA dioxygenase family)
MTEEQQYLFDLQGYLIVESVLPRAQIARMLADFDKHNIAPPGKDSIDYRFGDFLKWGDDWRNLIDHPRIVPILLDVIGPTFRLDHAYGMAMKADGAMGKFGGLHHQSAMFDHGCFYVAHGARAHNGLVVVSYALTDAPPGSGGFCCIPGSHKSLFKTPPDLFKIENNPLVKNVSMKAGDALIFSEALTHGTMPWMNKTGERRSVLMKYCPGYMQWAQAPMSADLANLTERQKLILEPGHVWERKPVPTASL